jgi:molybdate transport system regulatory protein
MRCVRIKIQIPHGDNIALGPGKADLLNAINHHGSISAAAKSMHMSYKRAWELVDVMNRSFKQPLISTSVGGSHGGGAALTDFGLEALQRYRALVAKSANSISAEIDGLLAMLNPQ